MNITQKHIDLTIAFAGGLAVGVIGIGTWLEGKYKKELALNIEVVSNAYQTALNLHEQELDRQKNVFEQNMVTNQVEAPRRLMDSMGKPIAEASPPDFLRDVNVTSVANEPVKNQYHQALEHAQEEAPELVVEGGVNDYGISYIDEDDYLDEEDGRYKGKIEILMTENGPQFTMEGDPLENWEQKVGDSILVDMYNKCPPGTEGILWVRNHRTNEDYEVVREEP